MLYAIYAQDIPNSVERRASTRARHLEYVRKLADQGRLVLAGPHPAIDSPDPGPAGMTGSLIVADFETQNDARDWVRNDPNFLEGVFASLDVKPFRQVYP